MFVGHFGVECCGKLKAAGYRLLYPDFAASMRDMGERYAADRLCPPGRKRVTDYTDHTGGSRTAEH